MKAALSNLAFLFLPDSQKKELEWQEIFLFLTILLILVLILFKADSFFYGYLTS